MHRPILFVVLSVFLAATTGVADPPKTLKPSVRERCPVCGMFVSKYPNFIAAVTTSDGRTSYFDGPKDMFKFLTEPKRYLAQKAALHVWPISVTDYYRVMPIDGRSAWYVIGSDVRGPMGKELIPFGSEQDAREFQRDHQGRRILRFEQITAADLKELD